MRDPLGFGAPLVAANRTGHDTTRLRCRATQRAAGTPGGEDDRLPSRHRRSVGSAQRSDEDETEAHETETTGDYALDEYLRRHRRDF